MTDKQLPLYLQIAQDLRQQIQTGAWQPGQRIPTEFALCDHYHVSRITVRKAIDELVKDNLIVRQRAKGSFVSTFDERIATHYTSYKSFTNEMKEVGIDIETLQVNVRLGFADYKLSNYLQVGVGDQIIMIERVRGAQGKAFAYFKTYLKFNPLLSLEASTYQHSFYDYLATLGIRIKHVREIVEAIEPSKKVAQILMIPQKKPVLKRARIVNNPLVDYYEYSECFYIGSQYKYAIDFTQQR